MYVSKHRLFMNVWSAVLKHLCTIVQTSPHHFAKYCLCHTLGPEIAQSRPSSYVKRLILMICSTAWSCLRQKSLGQVKLSEALELEIAQTGTHAHDFTSLWSISNTVGTSFSRYRHPRSFSRHRVNLLQALPIYMSVHILLRLILKNGST